MSAKIIIFQCNSFNDGDGDIGNLIDVANQVMQHFGAKNVIPYFVITAELAFDSQLMDNMTDKEVSEFAEQFENESNEKSLSVLQAAVNRFKQESKYIFDVDVDKQVFALNHPQYDSSECHSLDEYLEKNVTLRNIYASADIIFTIATPFPELRNKEKFTKKNVEYFTITEHCNTSLAGPAWSYAHFHHYVTGISKYDSGLMVSDMAKDPVAALQAITDQAWLEKIGLTMPVSDKDAAKFIKTTLVVPVYLSENQKHDLAPLIHLVSQSPLARKYQKMIFHVNKRAYDAELYKTMDVTLTKRPDTPKIELIVGHYFENPNDFKSLFQLASSRGVAIVSSDKVLELAISCDVMPLYPPVSWKRLMHRNLHDLVHDNPDLSKLMVFLGKTSGLKKTKFSEHKMLHALQQDDSVAECLTMQSLIAWQEKMRPVLLQGSFYKILHEEILDHHPSLELENNARFALRVFLKYGGSDNNPIMADISRELHEAENGSKTYFSAFMHALVAVVVASENANDKQKNSYNLMLEKLDIDMERTLFAIKNYLNLSTDLTGITEKDKQNLAEDWASELKFMWTKSSVEQLAFFKKVVRWANQLSPQNRMAILQCVCRELNPLSDKALL